MRLKQHQKNQRVRSMTKRRLAAAGCITILLLVLFFITGCTSTPEGVPEFTAPESQNTPEKPREYPMADSLSQDAGVSGIRSVFGKAKSVTEVKVDNIHNPTVKDSRFTVTYDGLEFSVYYAASVERSFLVSVKITSALYPVEWGLPVGASLNQLQNKLGSPEMIRDAVLQYTRPGSTPGFDRKYLYTINNDRVAVIQVVYNLGG